MSHISKFNLLMAFIRCSCHRPHPHLLIWMNSCWDSERFIVYEGGRDMQSFRAIRLQTTMWDKGLALTLIPLRLAFESDITHCCCASPVGVYMWPCLSAEVQTSTTPLPRVSRLFRLLFTHFLRAKMSDMLKAHNRGSLFGSCLSAAISQKPSRSHPPS